MLRKLLCAAILISPVLSEDMPKEDQKKEIISQYTEALNLYKIKQYQKAYELFNILFEKNLDNVNINFYLGRSAFELKKYHESIIAFERVLFSNPDSPGAKLEIAKAYYMSGDFNEAKRYFEEIYKDEKTPENVKEGVGKYLAAIEKNRKKHFLNGVLLAGINYDSNVNTRSDYDIYSIPSLPAPVTNTVADEQDFAHQEVLILNHKYKKSAGTIYKNDFMFFTKTMNNHKNSAKDIDMVSFTPAINHIYKNGLSIDYALFADALWVDDKSNLRTYGLIPRFTYILDKTTITSGYFKYQIKKNQPESLKINDSKYIELNNIWQFIYTKGISYGGAFTYTRERQDSTQANNTIDKESFMLKANSTYMIGNKFSLAPVFSYKYTKYDKDDFLYNVKRSDDEYKFALMGTYIYSPKWLFQLGGDYTKNDSNIPANEYNKHTFTFNIIRPF